MFAIHIHSKPIDTAKRSLTFPKSVRILRSGDFRTVYEQGSRFACPFFIAFCLRSADNPGPRIGFTVPRALGKSVVRNRMKRRLREAVRLHLPGLPAPWRIVINPRRAAFTAAFGDLEREMERLFSRCGA